jgi:hypothetical protein
LSTYQIPSVEEKETKREKEKRKRKKKVSYFVPGNQREHCRIYHPPRGECFSESINLLIFETFADLHSLKERITSLLSTILTKLKVLFGG